MLDLELPSLNNPPLSKQLKWLDDLVRMGEEPEEISYMVLRAADTIKDKVLAEIAGGEEEIDGESAAAMVRYFMEYIYLGDWPRGRKPRLSRASENVIMGFFLTLPVNAEKLEHAFNPNRFIVIAKLFGVVEREGYSVNLPLRLKLIDRAQREICAIEDSVGGG